MSPSYKVQFYVVRLNKFMSDAIHFLNYGHKNVDVLYKSNIESHINEMFLMCDYLDSMESTPLFISIEKIEELEKEMIK